jgi:chemotaxis protein histidine kinase CheA
VSVNDISQQIKLEKNLEESKEQNKKQMEWLFTILNVDAQMLEEFMKSSEEEILSIKHSLDQDPDYGSINDIYRSVHLIKGNASMLGLTFITEQTHAVEESLLMLHEKKLRKSETHKNIKKQLNELFNLFNQVKNLIDRIGKFHSQFRPTRKHETSVFFKSMSNLIESLCKKYKKEARLDYTDYDASIVPHHHRLLIRDFLVQLIRNAVYHGIETAEERLKKNKDRQGTISISNSQDSQWFYLRVKDDGQGLQIDNLKAVAKKKGKYKTSDINKWSKNQIIELIFLAGMTTAEKADLTAGRGMGMDIIKNKLKNMAV